MFPLWLQIVRWGYGGVITSYSIHYRSYTIIPLLLEHLIVDFALNKLQILALTVE